MLQPKKTKFRKQFKGRIHGTAKGGTDLNFGGYGLNRWFVELEQDILDNLRAFGPAQDMKGRPNTAEPPERRYAVNLLVDNGDLTHMSRSLFSEAALAGTGFGNDSFFTKAFCQKRLSQRIVDLMGAGVVQVFTFQVDFCAVFFT